MKSKSRVLIVDDEESARRALRMVLEHEGFVVEEASNGDDALRQWAGFAPSVIVTDNKMPGVSGLDIALHLKERVQIPVVIFSGHVDGTLRDAAGRLGVHIIEKPDIERLVATIKKVVWLEGSGDS